ncbi:MAG: lytic transglycosylase, partial [Spirosoma sp.]|nr:lytic transglycosylase [Spirosoma sp.]
MTFLNRSLLKSGVFCAVLALTSMGLMPMASAEIVGQSGDSTIAKKDTVAALLTVPDSLLKQRLAKLQNQIPLKYHKAVQEYIDYYTFRRPGRTKVAMERMPLFFPLYERMLAEYGLPDELKFLSIVESDLTPRAVSHAGAGGLWQIMPGTGRDLHLYQDDYVDERMDPVKATEAACKYLRDLYAIFGDWELALAAYNCGPGAVKRAMRRSGGDSFYTIYDALPKETRGYVPQFVAFTYLMHHGNDHGIFAEKYEYPIPHDTIQVTGYFNLETFAKHSTMPLADLQKMNPAITTSILPEYTKRYPLRVPRQQYAYFASHRRAVMDSASQQPATMAHMLLAQAEDIRYGTDSIRSWVALGSNPLAGITLEETVANDSQAGEGVATSGKKTERASRSAAQLPVTESADESEDQLEPVVARNRMGGDAALRPSRRQTYVVKKGDNLGDIADRYGIELDDLRKWNQLRSSIIQQGDKLVLFKEPAETRAEPLVEQTSEKAPKKAEVL